MEEQNKKQMSDFEKPKEPENLDRFIIPECCREGWESCKHVPKPYKKTKQNVGL